MIKTTFLFSNSCDNVNFLKKKKTAMQLDVRFISDHFSSKFTPLTFGDIGWMDEWVDWMRTWMDGIDGLIDRWMDGWVVGWMDEWIY